MSMIFGSRVHSVTESRCSSVEVAAMFHPWWLVGSSTPRCLTCQTRVHKLARALVENQSPLDFRQAQNKSSSL